ncbi:MAG: PTS-dependent dihydroxyacetone kinase phosphotransferase subunit DhaM [Eubacteriaceae bacterium]|jgi:dihydroxyacetone kinase phosphotransfer subunit|nr:PTS-dependent dihydroxyacetone kinase phosphotransferase subunit DhaM [Eubacteriaceae bacterium]
MKTGIIIVSHSEKLAEGVVELINEMNDGNVLTAAAGGLEDGGLGTDAMRIQEAIETMSDVDHILVYCDLGSAILSTETALDFMDEELAKKVIIVNAPVVEGAFAGMVQATFADNIEDVIKESENARNIQKGS